MRIYGYNLRTDIEKGPNGQIDINKLIHEFITDNIKCDLNVPSEVQINSISHVPQKNPEKWERLMASLVCALTGKIPSRDEIKRGRQIYEALPKSIRKICVREEIFSLFPYIIAGFKINLKNINRNDTNNLENAVLCTGELLSTENPVITTFFCAHKEDREVNKDMLRPNIKRPYATRAINLFKGLIKNSKKGCGSIILHQARGNYYGINTIFPQIFLKYVSTRSLPALRFNMEQHFAEISRIASESASPDIKIEVRDIVSHYQSAETMASRMFGENWKYARLETLSNRPIDRFVHFAVKDLSRLITHSEIDKTFDESSREYLATLADNERKATELFEQNSRMTIVGRAILDCMFFYQWGRVSQEEGLIGVGLDTDHNIHQMECFSLGYSKDLNFSAPILYARKNGEKDKIDDLFGLDNLSIRQFWR